LDDEGPKRKVAGAICKAKNPMLAFKNLSTLVQLYLPTYSKAQWIENRGTPPDLVGQCVYLGKNIGFHLRP
jgi:hypothetical protein